MSSKIDILLLEEDCFSFVSIDLQLRLREQFERQNLIDILQANKSNSSYEKNLASDAKLASLLLELKLTNEKR